MVAINFRFAQSEKASRIVIENVALLLFGQKRRAVNALNGHFDRLRPNHLVAAEHNTFAITAGADATVKLAQGIGVGSTAVAATAAFPTFSEEPHKYEDAPAKYLMTPDLKTGVSGCR